MLTASLAGKGSMAGEPARRPASLPELQYADRQSLPNFEIGGQAARVHSQGLFVTDRYYYVSGRLERRPRRPLLVRFDRGNTCCRECLNCGKRFTTRERRPGAGEGGSATRIAVKIFVEDRGRATGSAVQSDDPRDA